ncbi:hypothetical protein B9Z55_014060 [Caenorhabditis nigoni]|uniref:Uncharacterized protein n=1 Tax=Caenorhabditis nigoni TaxID=1611254 RepID=A0A2G5U4C7_9PELO|nr:hypothetical protein B9Z55_014060 [Caenorhabditis nigoni]
MGGLKKLINYTRFFANLILAKSRPASRPGRRKFFKIFVLRFCRILQDRVGLFLDLPTSSISRRGNLPEQLPGLTGLESRWQDQQNGMKGAVWFPGCTNFHRSEDSYNGRIGRIPIQMRAATKWNGSFQRSMSGSAWSSGSIDFQNSESTFQ